MQAMTQNEIVLKFMRENGYITSMQAFGEGITRLASRIHASCARHRPASS